MKKKPCRWNGWSHCVSFFTVHSCVSPSCATIRLAFQNGTPLTRNSEWPLTSTGGSVSTTFTGVAPAVDGGTIGRVHLRQRRVSAAAARLLKAIVSSVFDVAVLDAAIAAVVEHRAQHQRLPGAPVGVTMHVHALAGRDQHVPAS